MANVGAFPKRSHAVNLRFSLLQLSVNSPRIVAIKVKKREQRELMTLTSGYDTTMTVNLSCCTLSSAIAVACVQVMVLSGRQLYAIISWQLKDF